MTNAYHNDLLEISDNKYELVAVISKRARQIIDSSNQLTENNGSRPIHQAVDELKTKRFNYTLGEQ